MENSPTESLLSGPDGDLPSLFETTNSLPTLNPMDMMTPPNGPEDCSTPSGLSAVAEDDEDESSPAAHGSSDKKATKKRKSWGQVLPEPKTNLPPRKRAKTEDEKEQRRVERVLRNRRAAQSSRERKRLEVEALEQRNQELEDLLAKAQKTTVALMEELKRYRGDSSAVLPSVPAGSPLDNTLSSQLFVTEAGKGLDADSLDKFVAPAPTVNPASLSPPPTEEQETETADVPAPTTSDVAQAAASDMTQHSAAMLCDLQCQSEPVSLPLSSLTSAAWMSYLAVTLSTSLLFMCQRPLTQIALSLKAGFSIRPSPHILATIIWLVTTQAPASSRTTSTSTSGSPTPATSPSSCQPNTALPTTAAATATMSPPPTSSTSSRKVTSLRVKVLRKILSSSPNLARPLQDATFAALRLVSRGHDDRVRSPAAELGQSSRTIAVDVVDDGGSADDELTRCLKGITLPSKETLLALIWTIRVEQQRIGRKRQVRQGMSLRPESGVLPIPTPDVTVGGSTMKRWGEKTVESSRAC